MRILHHKVGRPVQNCLKRIPTLGTAADTFMSQQLSIIDTKNW